MAQTTNVFGGAAQGVATGAAFGPAGAAAGGIIGAGAALYGAHQAGQMRRRMEQYLNRQDTENKSWYNQNAFSDYTQRSDTQNLIRSLRQQLDRRNRIANNTAVVTGSTPEQQAVQKEQSNKVISDVYSNIGARGQQYKDMITNRYLAMKNNIGNHRMGMMEGTAGSYENLMNNGLGAIGDSFKNYGYYGQTDLPSIPTNINTPITPIQKPHLTIPQTTQPTTLKNIW